MSWKGSAQSCSISSFIRLFVEEEEGNGIVLVTCLPKGIFHSNRIVGVGKEIAQPNPTAKAGSLRELRNMSRWALNDSRGEGSMTCAESFQHRHTLWKCGQ